MTNKEILNIVKKYHSPKEIKVRYDSECMIITLFSKVKRPIKRTERMQLDYVEIYFKKNEIDIRQYFVGGMMSICDGKVSYHDVMWEHQIQQEFDSYLLDNWLSKEKFFKL